MAYRKVLSISLIVSHSIVSFNAMENHFDSHRRFNNDNSNHPSPSFFSTLFNNWSFCSFIVRCSTLLDPWRNELRWKMWHGMRFWADQISCREIEYTLYSLLHGWQSEQCITYGNDECQTQWRSALCWIEEHERFTNSTNVWYAICFLFTLQKIHCL